MHLYVSVSLTPIVRNSGSAPDEWSVITGRDDTTGWVYSNYYLNGSAKWRFSNALIKLVDAANNMICFEREPF